MLSEKAYVLCLLEILQEHSDAEHILPMREIIAKMQEAQDAVYAYVGAPEQIVMRCDRWILDDVIDRFGSDVRITGDGEEHFTAAFTAPPRGIKFWALQYLPYVELLQPLWLRDEIIESIGKNKYLK